MIVRAIGRSPGPEALDDANHVPVSGPFRAAAVLALATACSGATGPERPIEGKVLYDQYCARCHGPDGNPVADVDPPCAKNPALAGCAGSFADRARMDRMSDDVFKGAVLAGRPPPPPRPGGAAPGKGMPAFPTQFTDATMMVLIAYVRGLSGSRGSHAPEPGTPDAQ